MRFNEHFVVGRIKRRRLRKPVIEGWLCDERGAAPARRVQLSLAKVGVDGLALPIPGEHDFARLGQEATELALSHETVDLLLGWPESIVIVRRNGVMLHGEGDVVHFGELALDRLHRMRRSGYEYLTEGGSEVRVELGLTEGGRTQLVMLNPGESASFGPYSVTHLHSYDPSDRPGGVRHHGYFFRVRRLPDARLDAASPVEPHPLDLDRPEQVAALARERGVLKPDEALWAEQAVFAQLLARYEGPRQNLEQLVRDTGPSPPTLTRRGEVVVVESAHVSRGEHGETLLGRARVFLEPTGQIRMVPGEAAEVPGRLRKPG